MISPDRRCGDFRFGPPSAVLAVIRPPEATRPVSSLLRRLLTVKRRRTLTPQNQYRSIAYDADRRPDPTPIHTDGLITHRGAPVLRWRWLNPSILKTGRPACHRRPLTSPRHSIGAIASRAARSCEAGSFLCQKLTSIATALSSLIFSWRPERRHPVRARPIRRRRISLVTWMVKRPFSPLELCHSRHAGNEGSLFPPSGIHGGSPPRLRSTPAVFHGRRCHSHPASH